MQPTAHTWVTPLALLLLSCTTTETPSPAVPDPPDQFSKVVALVHGRLIDGTGSEPNPDAVILIEDGRFAAVGSQGTIEVPSLAEIIDLGGATVLPGFVNAHVHEGYHSPALRAWARGGVTTVRDLGADPSQPLFQIRDTLLEDSLCARLVAAGPIVTVPNGYPMIPWGSSSGLPVLSPQDAREKVGALLDDGADLIKIAVERGGSFGRPIPTLSREEIDAIVATAHDHTTVVSAHVLVAEDLELALDGGVDDVAHMVTDHLPDRLIQLMVERSVVWVPTLELWHNVNPRLGQAAVSNLRRFVQAGGLVALGTDYAGYNSTFDLGMPIREIGWMLEAGMTPMEIIVASTSQAARVCHLEKEVGTIEEGKLADLLVVEGDPLSDLEVLNQPILVFRDGVVIRSAKRLTRPGIL